MAFWTNFDQIAYKIVQESQTVDVYITHSHTHTRKQASKQANKHIQTNTHTHANSYFPYFSFIFFIHNLL